MTQMRVLAVLVIALTGCSSATTVVSADDVGTSGSASVSTAAVAGAESPTPEPDTASSTTAEAATTTTAAASSQTTSGDSGPSASDQPSTSTSSPQGSETAKDDDDGASSPSTDPQQTESPAASPGQLYLVTLDSVMQTSDVAALLAGTNSVIVEELTELPILFVHLDDAGLEAITGAPGVRGVERNTLAAPTG